jgi:flagellar basal-body rod protein FlgB
MQERDAMSSGTPSLVDPTMRLLERALDFRVERHSLIASNIANAETPRYQATDIEFEGTLKEALSFNNLPTVTRTNSRHLPVHPADHIAITPHVVARTSVSVGNDRNSVDVDTEMTRLAQNSLLYNAAAQMLSRKFGGIRLAIDGGK